MNNLLARFFKKKTLVANLPQVSTVVMFDPMVPCPKIPKPEKPYIIPIIKKPVSLNFDKQVIDPMLVRNSETGKIDHHPDYKKIKDK
jgi:hypothetical protein